MQFICMINKNFKKRIHKAAIILKNLINESQVTAYNLINVFFEFWDNLASKFVIIIFFLIILAEAENV